MPAPRQSSPAPVVQSVTLPAPTGGLNTMDAGAAMPPSDCILLYNMVASEYGLRTRFGYREWCTGVGDATTEVRSILPFTGSAKDGSKDRLFAVTQLGIYDVSASSTAPTQVVGGASGVAWPNTDSSAGTGISTVFVNLNGQHFLLFCDESNGYYTYNESNTTWTRVTNGGGATQVTGTGPDGATPVDPSKFCFVTVFANRVWFVQRDTGYAWYTGVSALYGALTPFNFGTRFRSGGDLRGLYNWTIDGGSGVVNSLVGISGGGDVVIYQGTDPSAASTFGLKGVWSLGGGGVPAGRRIATDWGGDMLVVSTIGLIPLSKLTMGNPIFDRSQYLTAKISNTFNRIASASRSLSGWSLRLHPEDSTLMICVPNTDGTMQQLVMALNNRSWSVYRDMPFMVSSEAWGGKLYFGTQDGRVCINTDYLDAVTLASPGTYSAIQFEMLSAFQNLGSQRKKRVHMIRPTFLSDGGSVTYTANARFGYDFSELPAITVPVVAADGTSTVFTLSRYITASDQVYVDRLLQVYGVDYTLAGNIVTFTSAPPNGALLNVYYLDGNQIPVPVTFGVNTSRGWDNAIWDTDVWGGQNQSQQNVSGGQGMGQDAAIILRGAATSRTSLVGIDVFFDVGGLL